MKNTRTNWLPAAQDASWFSLSRHDEPDPEPEPVPDPEGDPADPDPGPDPADDPADPEDNPDEPDPGKDALGDAGKKALERMKAERAAAKKEAATAKKQAADLARKVQEFEDAQKSELEKAQAAAERAQQAVEAANRRAVTAEIKAAAADRFDDADVVLALVGQDPTAYVTAAGDVDTDAIGRALTDLADRKPKLLKQAAAPVPVQEAPKTPKVPDPGQGPRGASPEVDLMKATEEEFRTALAKFTTIRPH